MLSLISNRRSAREPGLVSGRARLYVLIPSLSGGGAERVALALLKGLNRELYSIALVTLVGGADGVALPDDVSVISMRSRSFTFALPSLVKLFRRSPPDLLLSHMSLPNAWAVFARGLARRRFPIVCVEHTVPSAAYSQGTRAHAFLPMIIRATYRSADAVVASSKNTAEDLVSVAGLSRSRVKVIENPVLSAEIEQLASEPPAHPWLRSDDVDVVLAVGRLVPAKDYPLLIHAFREVLDRHPRARLLILGEGALRAGLEDLVAQLGLRDYVSLPGWAENPYSAMSRAAVVAVSSRFEGGPSTLI